MVELLRRHKKMHAELDEIVADATRKGYASPTDMEAIDILKDELRKLKEDAGLWVCPINKDGCTSDCGNYGCGN